MDSRKYESAIELATHAKDADELEILFAAAETKLEVIRLRGETRERISTASVYCSGGKIWTKDGTESKRFFECSKEVGEVILYSQHDKRYMLIVWKKTDLRYQETCRAEFDTHTLALVPITELD